MAQVKPDEDRATADRVFLTLLAVVRSYRGLTQQAVAKSLGKSRSVVAFVESGRRPFRQEDVGPWAAALGVEAELLDRLRMACYGYVRDEDGDWLFWSDVTDPESYEWGASPEEDYVAVADAVTASLNEMVGESIADYYGFTFVPRSYPGLNGMGIELPATDSGPRVVMLPFPRRPLFGDPNEPEPIPMVQGTRDDLSSLLAELTESQVALTAAFVRGLLAQARSRRPPAG